MELWLTLAELNQCIQAQIWPSNSFVLFTTHALKQQVQDSKVPMPVAASWLSVTCMGILAAFDEAEFEELGPNLGNRIRLRSSLFFRLLRPQA